jgi:hypothetical protein
MSEVKKGDRVKIVIEDDVLRASNFGLKLEGWGFVPSVGELGVVSVEVIEPMFVLPTKRWAQVTADGYLWTLSASGMWVNLDGLGLAHATKLTESSHLRVISEGVDE